MASILNDDKTKHLQIRDQTIGRQNLVQNNTLGKYNMEESSDLGHLGSEVLAVMLRT